MKQEISWINLWILSNATLAILCLTYFYLNNEFAQYATYVMGMSLLSIAIVYSLWKYKQLKFVEKRSIVIQILQE